MNIRNLIKKSFATGMITGSWCAASSAAGAAILSKARYDDHRVTESALASLIGGTIIGSLVGACNTFGLRFRMDNVEIADDPERLIAGSMLYQILSQTLGPLLGSTILLMTNTNRFTTMSFGKLEADSMTGSAVLLIPWATAMNLLISAALFERKYARDNNLVIPTLTTRRVLMDAIFYAVSSSLWSAAINATGASLLSYQHSDHHARTSAMIASSGSAVVGVLLSLVINCLSLPVVGIDEKKHRAINFAFSYIVTNFLGPIVGNIIFDAENFENSLGALEADAAVGFPLLLVALCLYAVIYANCFNRDARRIHDNPLNDVQPIGERQPPQVVIEEVQIEGLIQVDAMIDPLQQPAVQAHPLSPKILHERFTATGFDEESVPEGMLDRTTYLLMDEPRVLVTCGHSYNASTLNVIHRCPECRNENLNSVPNYSLRDAISSFVEIKEKEKSKMDRERAQINLAAGRNRSYADENKSDEGIVLSQRSNPISPLARYNIFNHLPSILYSNDNLEPGLQMSNGS